MWSFPAKVLQAASASAERLILRFWHDPIGSLSRQRVAQILQAWFAQALIKQTPSLLSKSFSPVPLGFVLRLAVLHCIVLFPLQG